MVSKEHKDLMALVRRTKRKMSKVRVGLPKRVLFEYSRGIVEVFPTDRKWVVSPKGMRPVIHIIPADSRNDVTKYKAKRMLKLAILKLLRDDS